MALPKRRHSKARGRKRRTHYVLKKKGISLCSHCNSPNAPHRVCSNCGYYKNREVLAKRTS